MGQTRKSTVDDKRRLYIEKIEELFKASLPQDPLRDNGNLIHLIRILPAWGRYPWRSLDLSNETRQDSDKHRSGFKNLIRLLSVFGISTGYLLAKYLAYTPYKRFKPHFDKTAQIAWISPSTHLPEFESSNYLGFWGGIKWSGEQRVETSIWVQLPYRNLQQSHRMTATKIYGINRNTKFTIIPLAHLFTFRILMKSIKWTVVLHFYLARKLYSRNFHASAEDLAVFISESFGAPISRSILNDLLLEQFFRSFKHIRCSIFLLEGQSWELSAIRHARKSGSQVIGNLHVPLRNTDTQILNHFIFDIPNSEDYCLDQILCSDVESYEDLKMLASASTQIRIVEAQRFIMPQSLISKRHWHDPKSHKILYVADSNIHRTITFINWVESLESSHLDFYIQSHPASPLLPIGAPLKMAPLESHGYSLILFGKETSAFLQAEFSESNIAFFDPDNDKDRKKSISVVGTQSDLNFLLDNEKRSNRNFQSLFNLDPEFTKWKEVLSEI